MNYLALNEQAVDSETDLSESSDDDFSIFELALALNEVNEDLLLGKHGYIKKEDIFQTIQGQLFIAENKNDENNVSVAIKKISKELHSKHESIDIDGFKFVIDKDIIKESLILKHLTVDNECIGNFIVKYIDFFQSETDYYLVMEYIESNMNLKDFVIKSHEFIKTGQLKLKSYKNIIKYLMWQLAVTMYWLHNDIKCCHLDLFPENIMLKNAEFLQNSDGSICINPQIEIKLTDFGVSEIFDINDMDSFKFKCNKQYLSLLNEQYLSPNINNNEYYDASSSDMWSFGMIIYFCFIGSYPFKIKQENEFNNEPKPGTPYWSIYNKKLKQYLGMNNLLKFINPNILSVLNGLLNINEKKQFDSKTLLKHKWFNTYYTKYAQQQQNNNNNMTLKNIYYRLN